jgi:preprotein translocase subunit SecA
LAQTNGDGLGDRQLIQMLSVMQHGTQLAFDTKTHRKARRQYIRLRYVYLAAHLLENRAPEEITDQVLVHLQGGLQALQAARGEILWDQLRQRDASLNFLSESLKFDLAERLGEEKFKALLDCPLDEISVEDRRRVQDALGHRMQNEAYRELLLRVISEQWVEYLTRVESLRVSIRMEAYAQRDPLVQYKSKAMEMFQNLLVDIRTSVIARVFTYNPRSYAELFVSHGQPTPTEEPENVLEETSQKVESKRPSKKKRHRH